MKDMEGTLGKNGLKNNVAFKSYGRVLILTLSHIPR